MKKFFLPLLALLCLVLPARAAGFYDLPADHWAQEEIRSEERRVGKECM